MIETCIFRCATDTRSHRFSLDSFEDLVEEITPHERRDHKDGPLISGAVFDGPRGKRNVERVTLGLLDFDGLTKDQRDIVLANLEGLRYLYYTTFSHRPPVYKFRLILPLSRPILPEEWAEWWPRFAHHVGKDLADPAPARNIACVFYTPSCPQDGDPEHRAVTDGQILDVDALLAQDFPPGYDVPRVHESDVAEVPPDFDPHPRLISYLTGRLADAVRQIESIPFPGPVYPDLNALSFKCGRWTPHILGTAKVREALVSAALRRNPNPDPPDKYLTIVSKAMEDGQQVPWVPRIGYPLTDSGHGKRYADLQKGRVRWVLDWQRWVAWDGARWTLHGGPELARANVASVSGALEEEAEWVDNTDYSEALKKAAHQLQSTNKISNVLTEAKTNTQLHARQDHFDRDPWLIACPNGVVDLRTGRLRDAHPDDMILSLTGCAYDPGARSRLWENFVRDVTAGDAELAAYLQRAIGFSLTGSTQEHALFFAYGGGLNGKGTMFETIASAFGDYYVAVAKDFLIERRNEKHETELASLYRKRMAMSPEQPANKHWDEVKVKQLTGGDTISARRMREDEWTFRPTHTLWATGNNLPHVRGLDKGIWRRLHLIPFVVDFSDRVDVRMPDKLAEHLPAVLTWCVEGAKAWLDRGLDAPSAVRDATEEYKEEENPLSEFMSECFRPSPGGFVSRREMRQRYSQYCHRRQELHPIGPRQLVRSLRQLGYKEAKQEGVRGFTGIEFCQ